MADQKQSKMEHLVTIKQYSQLKGCHVQNIYGKINRGTFDKKTKKIGYITMVIVSDEEYKQIKNIV